MRRTFALALCLAIACAGAPQRAPEPAAASPAGPAAPAAQAQAPAPPPAPVAAPTPPAPLPEPPPPSAGESPWWKGAVFYEVFVRSYQDSNGDGKGDLQGLISRLDYLNDGNPKTTADLGVDAIWLMPVFKSPSYHGYDTTDYETIQRDYGTNEDFQRLLDEAHKRGIKVIVDLVLNHTSTSHPWFKASASSPTDPKRDWYVWRQDDPGWGQPWNPADPTWHPLRGAYYYGVFWDGMPDLNYRNAEVRAEAKRIAKFWLDKGVDGFRLDAIRYLVEDGEGAGQADTPETHAFLKEFSAAVRRVRPDAALVGEAWSTTDDIAPYYGTDGRDEIQMLFDFPLAQQLVQAAIGGRADDLTSSIQVIQAAYPKGAVDAPFLTNHDQRRIGSLAMADPEKLKTAASLLLTMPGSPFIYYGEELGMQNGPSDDDRDKRTPMAWDGTPKHGFTKGEPWQEFAPGAEKANVARETKDPRSVLSRYRKLIAVRKASVALTRGDLQLLPVPNGRGAVLAFLRRSGDETVLVVHNLSSRPADTGVLDVAAAAAEPLLVDGNGKLVKSGTGWKATLPPRSTGIWRVK